MALSGRGLNVNKEMDAEVRALAQVWGSSLTATVRRLIEIGLADGITINDLNSPRSVVLLGVPHTESLCLLVSATDRAHIDSLAQTLRIGRSAAFRVVIARGLLAHDTV